jgi:hypothetical protein
MTRGITAHIRLEFVRGHKCRKKNLVFSQRKTEHPSIASSILRVSSLQWRGWMKKRRRSRKRRKRRKRRKKMKRGKKKEKKKKKREGEGG